MSCLCLLSCYVCVQLVGLLTSFLSLPLLRGGGLGSADRPAVLPPRGRRISPLLEGEGDIRWGRGGEPAGRQRPARLFALAPALLALREPLPPLFPAGRPRGTHRGRVLHLACLLGGARCLPSLVVGASFFSRLGFGRLVVAIFGHTRTRPSQYINVYLLRVRTILGTDCTRYNTVYRGIHILYAAHPRVLVPFPPSGRAQPIRSASHVDTVSSARVPLGSGPCQPAIRDQSSSKHLPASHDTASDTANDLLLVLPMPPHGWPRRWVLVCAPRDGSPSSTPCTATDQAARAAAPCLAHDPPIALGVAGPLVHRWGGRGGAVPAHPSGGARPRATLPRAPACATTAAAAGGARHSRTAPAPTRKAPSRPPVGGGPRHPVPAARSRRRRTPRVVAGRPAGHPQATRGAVAAGAVAPRRGPAWQPAGQWKRPTYVQTALRHGRRARATGRR